MADGPHHRLHDGDRIRLADRLGALGSEGTEECLDDRRCDQVTGSIAQAVRDGQQLRFDAERIDSFPSHARAPLAVRPQHAGHDCDRSHQSRLLDERGELLARQPLDAMKERDLRSC
jgi:hypothetical protein